MSQIPSNKAYRYLSLLFLHLLTSPALSFQEIRKSDVVSMYQADRATYQAYGITVLAWGGTPSPKSLSQAEGIRYFGSVGMVTEFARYYERFPESYEEGLCRDVEGNPIKVPWLTDHQHRGIPYWWCCTNQPQFRTYIRERVVETIQAGADGQHIDDHLGTAGAASHGGCFCDRCLTGFHRYVRQLPTAILAAHDIKDIDSFDYRQIVLNWRRAQPAGPVESWNQPHFELWMTYHLQEAAAFMMELRQLAKETAGRPIPLSANACLLHYPHSCDYRALDFFSAEIDQEAHRRVLSDLPIFAYRLAEGLGRPLAATASGQDWAFIKENSSHLLVQRWIALAFASGQSLMTPHRQWCYTRERGTHWYDGPAEQFAPLYQFVRANSDQLDGFETFADVTMVFSQATYRAGDDLQEAGRTLSEAGLSYTLAIAGDGTLDHPLETRQLRASKNILILGSVELERVDRELLEQYCGELQVKCYRSTSELLGKVKPAARMTPSEDYAVLPRQSANETVIHLVDRDPGKSNRPGSLSINPSAFGLKQIESAVLYQPGMQPVALQVTSNSVEVPPILIWGILSLGQHPARVLETAEFPTSHGIAEPGLN